MAPLQSVSRTAARIGLATFVGTAFALLGTAEAPRAAEPKKGGSVSHLDGIGPADA